LLQRCGRFGYNATPHQFEGTEAGTVFAPGGTFGSGLHGRLGPFEAISGNGEGRLLALSEGIRAIDKPEYRQLYLRSCPYLEIRWALGWKASKSCEFTAAGLPADSVSFTP
jgi:hypothetical protein